MHQTTDMDRWDKHSYSTYMYIHVLYTYIHVHNYMWRVVEALIDVVHVLANAVQWDEQHDLSTLFCDGTLSSKLNVLCGHDISITHDKVHVRHS